MAGNRGFSKICLATICPRTTAKWRLFSKRIAKRTPIFKLKHCLLNHMRLCETINLTNRIYNGHQTINASNQLTACTKQQGTSRNPTSRVQLAKRYWQHTECSSSSITTKSYDFWLLAFSTVPKMGLEFS